MKDEEIESIIEKRNAEKEAKAKEIVSRETPVKKEVAESVSIDKVGLGDIRLKIDREKSYEEQAQDVLGAMTVAEAVKDEETKKTLVEKKSEELKASAEVKVKKAQTAVAEAETNVQKAAKELNDGILSVYGIDKHLPPFLMKVVMVILSISYVINTIIIRVPMGSVRIFIDTLDGIFVRYEKVEDNIKPRIKIIGWIILGLIIAIAICLTVLKILNKI